MNLKRNNSFAMTEFHISYNLIHGLINTMFTYGYDRLLQQLTSNSAVQFTIMFYCKSSTKNDQTAVFVMFVCAFGFI